MRKKSKAKSGVKSPAKNKAVKKSSAPTNRTARPTVKRATKKTVSPKPVKKAPAKQIAQRKQSNAKPLPSKKVAAKRPPLKPAKKVPAKKQPAKPVKKIAVKKTATPVKYVKQAKQPAKRKPTTQKASPKVVKTPAKQPTRRAIKPIAGKSSGKPSKPVKPVKQAPKSKQPAKGAPATKKAPTTGKKAAAKQQPEKKVTRKPSKNLGGYNKVSQIVSSFIREKKINLAEGGISFHEAAHNIYLYKKAQNISLKDLSNNIDIIFYQHSGYKSAINWPDNVPFFNVDSFLKPQYLDSGYDITVSADLPGEGTDSLKWYYRGSIEGMLDEFKGEPKSFCRKYYNTSPVAYFKFMSADRAQGVVFYELLADRGPAASSEEAEKFGPPPSEEYGFDEEVPEETTDTPATGGATPPKKEEPKKTPPKAQPTAEETEKQIQLSKQREAELKAKEAADKSEIEKMQKRIELINTYKALLDQQLITLEEFKQMIKQ